MRNYPKSSSAAVIFNRLLADAFHFSFPDLVKNREGRLAPQQMRDLIKGTVMPLGRALLSCMLLFIVYVLVARYIGRGASLQVLEYCVLAAIGTGLLVFSIQAAFLICDMMRGKVRIAEGPIEPSWSKTPNSQLLKMDYNSRFTVRCRFVVGGEKFNVSESTLNMIAQNFEAGLASVRVYYTPSSKKILSVEAMNVD